jgi:3-ketosteroid 9alpha-monooxygenase subunit B
VRPYYRLEVAEVIDETPDARSLVLRVPPDLSGRFAYRPGQFLTVRVPHATSGTVARCYSLSSAPETDEHLKITVKRVPDGHASNWICDRVEPGATLELLAPAGTFTPGSFDRDLLLLAGGSGITPVMSIIKAALARGRCHLALVYANRDERSVIFAAELARLQALHPRRLSVRHRLDAAQGPPTADDLAHLLRDVADRDAFVCGPEPFLALARRALAEVGVPEHRIHVERFQSLVEDEGPPPAGPDARPDSTVQVELDGRVHRLPWPAGARLLDVLIGAGLNPPFSCRQGNCGACACRVVAGEVELVHNEILEDEDFADGYTLACQALPVSESVSVTYS